MSVNRGDEMNYQQAKLLVKERAGTKYRGTCLHLLQRLTNSLYSEKDAEGDVEKRVISKRAATMCGWLGVGEKQLSRLLEEIEEVHTLSRADGTIKYTMNFEPLKGIQKTADLTKRQKKERNADRAAQARDARGQKHIHDLYRQALGEIAVRTAPLQEKLTQYFAEGGTLDTPEKKAAYEKLQKAKQRRDEARSAAEEFERTGVVPQEWLEKLELLKDVTDEDIKREMLTWDVDRIRLAQRNATGDTR
jgi:hypothetical protein